MTEVPDHLLQRSREPPPAATEASAAADAPGPGAEVEAAPEAAAPAIPEPVLVPPAPPLPETRTGIPRWMIPVLVILPFWAVVYVGAFGTTKKPAAALTGAALGKQVYSSRCAACHGSSGEGGVGPALAKGDAKITFPTRADQVSWVENGSLAVKGKGYGDPNRPGGQRIAKTGGMPAWKGTLSDAEIQAVVDYERDSL